MRLRLRLSEGHLGPTIIFNLGSQLVDHLLASTLGSSIRCCIILQATVPAQLRGLFDLCFAMFDILIGIMCDPSTCPKSEVSLSQQFERLDLFALRLICRDLNPKDLPTTSAIPVSPNSRQTFPQESRRSQRTSRTRETQSSGSSNSYYRIG